MIIAIDGPAASGKGTLSRLVSEHFRLAWLDTGSLYRAVGLKMLRNGDDPADREAAEKAAKSLNPNELTNSELKTEVVGLAASKVAAIPEVRQALVGFQRSFAQTPPGGAQGAVLDGRDIGTVVCPDADFKVYVTASPEARAHRRFLELRDKGDTVTEQEVLAMTRERDARDTNRGESPLKTAEDAYLLDTTNLSIDAAFAALKVYISGSSN
jgi:cytidylate kinase